MEWLEAEQYDSKSQVEQTADQSDDSTPTLEGLENLHWKEEVLDKVNGDHLDGVAKW